MSQPLYIVDIIGEVVAATAAVVLDDIKANEALALSDSNIVTINYQKGHKIELIERLLQMGKAQDFAAQKYPLVYLVQDFDERRGRDTGIYAEAQLSIIIAHHTQKTHLVDDRYAKVFKPVLYPIYYELLNQLSKHKLIANADPEAIEHTKTDRLYWGKQSAGGNDGLALTDVLDAIEIQDLQLKFYYKTC